MYQCLYNFNNYVKYKQNTANQNTNFSYSLSSFFHFVHYNSLSICLVPKLQQVARWSLRNAGLFVDDVSVPRVPLRSTRATKSV